MKHGDHLGDRLLKAFLCIVLIGVPVGFFLFDPRFRARLGLALAGMPYMALSAIVIGGALVAGFWLHDRWRHR